MISIVAIGCVAVAVGIGLWPCAVRSGRHSERRDSADLRLAEVQRRHPAYLFRLDVLECKGIWDASVVDLQLLHLSALLLHPSTCVQSAQDDATEDANRHGKHNWEDSGCVGF